MALTPDPFIFNDNFGISGNSACSCSNVLTKGDFAATVLPVLFQVSFDNGGQLFWYWLARFFTSTYKVALGGQWFCSNGL